MNSDWRTDFFSQQAKSWHKNSELNNGFLCCDLVWLCDRLYMHTYVLEVSGQFCWLDWDMTYNAEQGRLEKRAVLLIYWSVCIEKKKSVLQG